MVKIDYRTPDTTDPYYIYTCQSLDTTRKIKIKSHMIHKDAIRLDDGEIVEIVGIEYVELNKPLVKIL